MPKLSTRRSTRRSDRSGRASASNGPIPIRKDEPTMNALDCCDWTDVRISTLRQLWDGGVATAEIGRQMGLSKNAVIGKVHRLRLPPRPSPIRQGNHSAGRERHVPVPKLADLVPLPTLVDPKPPSAPQPPPPPPATALSQARWRPTGAGFEPDPCCWPIGHLGTASFRYCDAPAYSGKPYCGEHLALAHARPQNRQPRSNRDEFELSRGSRQQQR